MSNNKMKGLLKGLRYISQIFESDEKEPEMQIGYPTDVKHVAHIGWDGPSVNSPSWMNEFKAAPAHSSAPVNVDEDGKEDASVKWVSEGSSRRSQRSQNSPAYAPSSPARSPAQDLPELPKSSGSRSSVESPSREKSDKPKQSSRRSSRNAAKDSSDISAKSTRQQKDPIVGSDSNTPDIPKKSRRKKSKDSSVGGSSRSRSKAQASEVDESVSKSRSNEKCHTATLNPLGPESEDNGFSGIS